MTDNMVVALNDEEQQQCDHREVPKGYVRPLVGEAWGIWEDGETIVRGED